MRCRKLGQQPSLVMGALIVLMVMQGHVHSSEQAIHDVMPRLVKVYGAGGIRRLHAYSTGFLVRLDDATPPHIVTVWNHVLDADRVTIVLNDGRRFFAVTKGAEPQLDLAVLKFEGDDVPNDLPCFDLSKSGTAGPGTRVLAFSNMFKVATGDEPVSVVHGVIAAETRLVARRGSFDVPYDGPVYVVDAATNNPGAGGGVLTTRRGTLLGMIGKELRNAETNTWINYAMPIVELREAVEQIITGDYERRVAEEEDRDAPPNFRPRDFGIVMVPDVLFRTPAYIDRVDRESAAADAGLLPNDLILLIGDQLVQSCRTLKQKLGRVEGGDTVRLVVRRGNELIPVDLYAEPKDE